MCEGMGPALVRQRGGLFKPCWTQRGGIQTHGAWTGAAIRAVNITQQTEGLRWRRGVKPQAVRTCDKGKQRRIKGG